MELLLRPHRTALTCFWAAAKAKSFRSITHGAHTHWVPSRDRFFLPIHLLRRVFRRKFVAGLLQAFQDGQLRFSADLTLLAQPKTFAAWLRPLFRMDWVVYAKPPFGGPEYVLQHLGRYTHRVAISNHRLVSFANQEVTFRWRDSAHSNEQKLMTLSFDEFLRRFLLHMLPKGFVRMRNFGFLANRRRATTLPLCFQLLGSAQPTEQELSTANDANDLRLCPKCGGPMIVIERLTAAEIQLRSPLLWSRLRHETAVHNTKTLRASPRSVPLRLAVEQISSSHFSTLSASHSFALLPAPGRAVLSSALRRTAPAHLNTTPSLY